MASRPSKRRTTTALNVPKSLVALQQEQATQRSKTNDSLTPPYKEPVRLRNACDQCHLLKRKCSGDMPCENCSLSNSSDVCSYRPTNRLGRPRGSRNRQKLSTHSRTNSKQHQIANLERDQNVAVATTEPIALPSEPLEHPSWSDMSWDYSLDADLLNIISTSNTDVVTDGLPSPNFDDQHLDSCHKASASPYSTGSFPVCGTLSHEQQLHQEPPLEWQQFPPPPAIHHPEGSSENAGGLDDHNKNITHQTQSPRPSCQCAQGLRALLSSLGRGLSSSSAGSQTQQMPERQPFPVDTILSNATRALEQWTALETCNYCCFTSGKEQHVENIFLLAFLSVQCVLGQLRSLTPDPDFAAAVGVRVGSFNVVGKNRTTVLKILCAVTAQDIEKAVEALRDKISDSFTSGLLAQIGNMFEDLTSEIRMLQQQMPIEEISWLDA